ncbi:hypothetical protein GGF42_003677 [Coemansia sp. RSA 2424]|nr:hypothetical protein GGF42_003677 [Coemansia sp. RSA 2424]
MNNHFHPSGAVAGPPGPGNQGFGVLGFGHLSHSVPGATSAGSGSVLTGAATVGSSMPAGALAGATGNITVMHPSSQVTAMPPPSSANSQHHAQQMHAQASHSQYLYQQQQHHQLLMNAAANGAWFLPTSNGLPQGMIGPMVSQAGAVAGAFGQDRSMAAAAAAAATQQQGTQALLSHLASLAPQQPAPSPQLAFTAANMASITQAQQQQHPNYMFMTQKWQQQLQQQLQHLHQMQAQQKPGSIAMRTVPVTPLPHQPINVASFSSAPQLTPLGDSMTQTQFQQLQLQQLQSRSQHHQQQQRQHMFVHHHSSASVDLGSLSSAFHHAAQYGQAMPGQISPMVVAQPNMPAGGPMPHMYMPMQFAPLAPLATSQHASNTGGNSTAAASPEVSDEDVDVDDVDDEDVSGEDADMEGRKHASAKHSKGTATPTSGVSGAARSIKAPAPYKRFRNSFIFFANERRKQWKLERPKKSKLQNRGFIQEMSKTWSTMSSEEKAPYIKMADEDKLRYEADVVKYGPLPTNSSSASLAGLAQDSSAGSTPLNGHSFAPSASASKAKAATAEITAEKVRQLALVPIAPAPAPAPVLAPVPVLAPTPAVDVDAAPTLAVATTATNVAGSAMPAAVAMAISIPTPVAMPDISIASASEHALEAISPAYTSAPHGSLAVQTMQANQGFSNSLAMPITPAAGMASAMACDPHEFEPAFLDHGGYHAYLQQILGQDLSPLTIEFDPSCFVNSDPASSDEAACLNPQALTAISTEALMSAVAEVAPQQQLAAVAEGSGAKTPSNGPPIITQVGTKRKSSSDGQPLTNLPSSIKRFRNSFIYYVNKKRREIQGPDDGVSIKVEVNNREFLKEMSAKWRTMSEEEKAPFTEMANADKERFLRQMQEYELEHPDEFNKAPKHRRRRSSTSASNVSISTMSASASESTVKLRDLQQQDVQSAESSSCGLNISMAGSAAPLFGSHGASAEATSMSRDSQWSLSTVTPLSTALSTPLLVSNMAGDKSDMQATAPHFSGLASVPEEMAICSDSSALFMAHSIGSSNSNAAAGTVAPALLSTVAEEPEESGRS